MELAAIAADKGGFSKPRGSGSGRGRGRGKVASGSSKQPAALNPAASPFVPPPSSLSRLQSSLASTTGTTATRLPSVTACAAGRVTNPPGVPQYRPRPPGSRAGSTLKLAFFGGYWGELFNISSQLLFTAYWSAPGRPLRHFHTLLGREGIYTILQRPPLQVDPSAG
jgi:hypothetical protein